MFKLTQDVEASNLLRDTSGQCGSHACSVLVTFGFGQLVFGKQVRVETQAHHAGEGTSN